MGLQRHTTCHLSPVPCHSSTLYLPVILLTHPVTRGVVVPKTNKNLVGLKKKREKCTYL